MIAVSAGHHKRKPGACYQGFCEHEEAVRWQKLIVEALGTQAVAVPTGVLKTKVEFINNLKPDFAVEIHFNSAKVWNDLNENGIVDEGEVKNVGKGCLTLHYPESHKGIMIANEVQDGLEQIYDRHWNGVMPGYYRMDPQYGIDYFLARTLCPSVIIEPEFIHRKYAIVTNRGAACSAIANALISAKEKLNG